MSRTKHYSTKPQKERAFLVGIEIRESNNLFTMEDSLSELLQLSDTAGLEIVGDISQKLEHPNPETYVGSGKVNEIKMLVEMANADVIVFDVDLSPRHQRELEEKFGLNIKVIDRTALILDIFAQHAQTREGSLQVELAQYEYRLPRLTRAWNHLARQAGGASVRTGSVGGVGLRGPGETQLEVDRREIRRRISSLKESLEKVRLQRKQHRYRRQKSNTPIIALVGYTNAGKSTLLNTITRSDIYTADKLFATLDPTTRRLKLSGIYDVLITDTVGFIQKLPTQLIAAFRATLEEIAEADLLLHVVDISHNNAILHIKSVQETLSEIGADNIPIITVLNKIDLLPDPDSIQTAFSDLTNSVAISAVDGTGIPDLFELLEEQLFKSLIPIDIFLPYNEGQLISLAQYQGQITKVTHEIGGVQIKGYLPGRLYVYFQKFIDMN